MHGCRALSDLTASRTQSVHRLTMLVKLDHRVAFCRGNALAMPCADHMFDVVISQKPGCISQTRRACWPNVLGCLPGGDLAFTDFSAPAPCSPQTWRSCKPTGTVQPRNLRGLSSALGRDVCCRENGGERFIARRSPLMSMSRARHACCASRDWQPRQCLKNRVLSISGVQDHHCWHLGFFDGLNTRRQPTRQQWRTPDGIRPEASQRTKEAGPAVKRTGKEPRMER
jgi:hypothetical protein